ncbi:META domain-containing protein [Variovorax sp. YR216]|uniref:META domain-containing protein n=1 Tax=Variovorax sp. YR216 TaxID=1882828 RepID=UPI00089D7328|nr:META domain-containing protein [Variovorax sp. YR216]SEB16006.1 Heat shock protein HslJ [Variovorax sp. YR216]
MNAKRSVFLVLGSMLLSLSAAAAGIEGPTWRLTSVQGLDASLLPTGPQSVTARFEGGRVSGFSGCNRFFGSYTLKQPDRLVIGRLAGSMMACGGNAMKVEGAVHKAMAGTFRPVLSGDGLTLLSTRGDEPVMTFKAEPKPSLVGLRSNVTGFNNGRQAVVSPMIDTAISMSFGDGIVKGFSGCNTFRASYTVDGNRIAVGAIATTRRTCADAVMQQEQQFLAALKSTTTWDFSGALLDMHRPDGERTVTGTREAG